MAVTTVPDEGSIFVFYNDNEPFVVAWLNNLVEQKHLPTGQINAAPIQELQGADCAPTSHFFAGIGGWPYALQLAGWPNNRPVWTGSCPCQPFSQAGQQKGEADARHLWPEWRRLIAECQPPTIFGEQVASRAGREWLSRVRADLETLGYAVGAADLCAASAGAPHIRQRLFWVADSVSQRSRRKSQHSNIGGALWNISGRRSAGWAQSRTICADEKQRRLEPGLESVAYGVPGRVGRLRAYGNAIVPQIAATFIRAFLEVEADRG